MVWMFAHRTAIKKGLVAGEHRAKKADKKMQVVGFQHGLSDPG